MAADIGRGCIEFRFTERVLLKSYGVSSRCRAIRRIVLAQCETLQGGKEDNHGKKE